MLPGRIVLGLLLALSGSGCDDSMTVPSSTGGLPPAEIRVLMVTSTSGFRHDSIGTARQVMSNLAASSAEFSVTSTEDLAMINRTTLIGYDVLFFALTSGELPFTTEQQTAIASFVAEGGGFLGVHSATDTLYEWPEYGRIVGAYLKEHPWTQQATVIVEDRSHPATRDLEGSFSILEEFYTFRENPRPNVQVLLRLDPVSVGSAGDSRFQQQLVGAIRWAASH